ncbi:dethiobiotin synthase [Pedobacter sp. Du54]|uniref:dethiobiotin synthase n=1 Tax=Pedobacter anseongensis TaxID=3133439 RepID=UPI0030A40EC9
MNESYFITGIGTGIGKTIASAVLTEKLKADYWKPIQAGDLDQSDSLMVKSLLSNSVSTIHPEQYRLNHPLSPHLAAKLDGLSINLKEFKLPNTENKLIIEGAGGLMVPLNEEDLILDLIKELNLQVIVVSKNYLGSINHTLLTVNTLKQNQISIKGIIFNGEVNEESERYILKYGNIKTLGRIPDLHTIDKEAVIEAGKAISL